MLDVKIADTDPMTVAYLEMSGDYDEIPQGFGRLFGWVQEYDHTPQGMPGAVYLTSPASGEEARWELWVPIEGGEINFGPDERRLGVKQIEPATVASGTYKGPYEGLGDAYSELESWIAEHGYQMCGAPREFYLNGPGEASPEEYLTEIQFPVKPLAR